MDFKGCCADFYAKPAVSWLLGDALHPGGLGLTERLGRLLDLKPGDRVLDIACGGGSSAVVLAKEFLCRMVGVDLAPTLISHARAAARREKLDGLLEFSLGDAEALPFSDGSFDAVLSECAISTFPDKVTSARETARVLKPGGRLGFTDVVVASGEVPEGLRGWPFQAGCIAGACSVSQYEEIFTNAGFSGWREKAHPESLLSLLDQVRGRLLALEIAGGLQRLDLSRLELDLAKKVLAELEEWVHAGRMNYYAFYAVKVG